MRNYWVTIRQNTLAVRAYVRILAHRINGRIVWLFGSSALVAVALALPIAASGDSSGPVMSQDLQTTVRKDAAPLHATIDTHSERVDQTQGTVNSESSVQLNQATKPKLRINGQSVPLPENGTVHTQITNAGGTTNLDVSIESNSSGNNNTSTYSSSSLNIQTTTESSTESSAEVSGP